MRVVIDIETNSLTEPTKLWVIVCKDIDTGEYHVFRELEKGNPEAERFLEFSSRVHTWIGHNILSYDYVHLVSLIGWSVHPWWPNIRDTLIASKLNNYSRDEGHSLEAYGEQFGLPKIVFLDFSKYSKELEEYCKRDVDITERVYKLYEEQFTLYEESHKLEHDFQLCINKMHSNGFYFNKKKAETLLIKVEEDLAKLDKEILNAFPLKEEFIRKIRRNKDGSINAVDSRYLDSSYKEDIVYRNDSLFRKKIFNPSSHKQIVDVLNEAGWKPSDKTATYIKFIRNKVLDIVKETHYKQYGWKVNETNLQTLPDTAPSPAKTLAHRILLESRRRTLVEWTALVRDDGRIHGDFQAIGAWTHRMAHTNPNTANIPNERDNQGRIKLLGGDLRGLWGAPKGKLLVGCDAESIQLRIFAHLIDDKEFTDAIVNGRKKDKTDPHSLNQRILGSVCKDRQAAKRLIYSIFFGAGISKMAEILAASEHDTKSALARLMERYQGFTHFKRNVLPADGERGYFIGLDGRPVKIPGDSPSYRAHLAMSGYLQNGEKVIMAKATTLWTSELEREGIPFLLVDLVHDEWQNEVPNNMDIAIRVGQAQCDGLRKAGEYYKLKCPMAGSFFNEDKHDYTIGTNWKVTH